jgi:hypothetical protein
MSALRVDIPIERLPGVAALYRDYVARTDTRIHRTIGGFRADAEAWGAAAGAGRALDANLLARMIERNTALGVSTETIQRLSALRDGNARVVVAGQQPGAAGGPLLSLYKAATAIVLAREIESRWKTPCVPLFWLGADDDDFEEIRELAIVSDGLAVVSVSIESPAHAPGRRVGDVAGAAIARAWDAVAPFLPKESAETSARVGEIVHGDDDLGSIAARVLVELTHGEIAIIDGREPAIRVAARETILAFFDREDALSALVREAGDALIADGYHAQLATGGPDSGLFLVRDGVRQRIPTSARAAAREQFVRDVTTVSPGVAARNIMQDVVFAPAAVVLGPAEIAYRTQLGRVYDVLGVDKPVAFPRLGAVFVPPAVRDATVASKVDASLLATHPAQWVLEVKQSLESPRAREAARRLEESFRAEAARFISAASERFDVRAREKLARRVEELATRVAGVAQGAVEQDSLAGAAQWPWLARAAELFARNGDAQERYLSAVVPYTFHGRDAWALVKDMATAHVRDALDGRVLHRVYSR